MPKGWDSNVFKKGLKSILAKYGEEYEAIAAALSRNVLTYMRNNPKASVNKAIAYAFRTTKFHDLNAKAVEDAVYSAATAGYGIRFPEGAEDLVRKKLMDVPWTGDGVPLSKRLHGVDNVVRNNILSTVGTCLRSYQTVREMTMELFDGYNSGKKVLTDAELPEYLKKLQTAVSQMFTRDAKAAKQSNILQKTEKMVSKVKTPELEAAYKDVLEAVAEGKESAIQKALWVATQEKSRYYAKRIARTEASRSYNEGFKAEAMSDPDVGGLQLKLNTSHPKPDICDEVASTDVGFGPGIFPKDQAPDLPLHPNCMCRWRKIWVWRMKPTGGKDQLPKLWKQGPNRVEEALKEVNATNEQMDILKQYGNLTNLMLNGTAEDIKRWAELKAASNKGEKEILLEMSKRIDNWETVLKAQTDAGLKVFSNQLLNVATEEELAALKLWTGGSYANINRYARYGVNVDAISKNAANQIEAVLNRIKTPEELIARRGTGVRHMFEKILGDWKQDPSVLIGQEFSDDGFTATSPLLEGGLSGSGENQAELFIRVPKGTHGAYIANLAHNEQEKELLLQKGYKYRIIKAEYRNNPIFPEDKDLKVWCEVVLE